IQDNIPGALQDLEKAIEYGNGQTDILKQAYTQRGIIKKLQGDKDGAQVDFERGARYGNPVAKAVAVQDNPISQLCGAMSQKQKGSVDLSGLKESTQTDCNSALSSDCTDNSSVDISNPLEDRLQGEDKTYSLEQLKIDAINHFKNVYSVEDMMFEGLNNVFGVEESKEQGYREFVKMVVDIMNNILFQYKEHGQ
ncbi:Tetratricopeptide repeat protein 36, partial [Entomortierella lignicola]